MFLKQFLVVNFKRKYACVICYGNGLCTEIIFVLCLMILVCYDLCTELLFVLYWTISVQNFSFNYNNVL